MLTLMYRFLLVGLSLFVVGGGAVHAGDDKIDIIGTWKNLLGCKLIFKKDGTYVDERIAATTKGTWKIKNGKLELTRKNALGFTVSDKTGYEVRKTLSGMQLSFDDDKIFSTLDRYMLQD